MRSPHSALLAVLLTTIAAVAALLPAPAVTPPAAAQAEPAATAGGATAAGTFFWANAWSASQTRGARPGLSGPQRIRIMLDLIHDHDATIGTLAEIEQPQIAAFRRAGSPYAIVRGQAGPTNAVFFDTRRYRLERVLRPRTFFYDGRRVRVPLVVLRDRSTGARIAVMAVRHPADTAEHPRQARWRQAALRRETRVVRSLRAAYDGRVSVFVAGDFNQRGTCALSARTRLVSPLATVSGCQSTRSRIDQAFADRTVVFTSYRLIRGPQVRRATNHVGVYTAGFTLHQPA